MGSVSFNTSYFVLRKKLIPFDVSTFSSKFCFGYAKVTSTDESLLKDVSVSTCFPSIEIPSDFDDCLKVICN
jgi:hypothetical protein